MASRRLGRIALENSTLFMCDMQEKFRPTIQYFPQIINVANRMLNAANTLDMPVVVTEQYPKGLGPTVPELDVSQHKVFPKTCFSMLIPEVEEHIKKMRDLKSVILCGIETQACIQQTALDLLERNYDVHVIVDACSSRSMVDRMYAFDRMKEAGAFLTTSESMMLALTKDAASPKFKQVQKLIWESAPDSGLLGDK
ncbi:isochorismatase domain-containing protein 2-like isoform X1 [Haliotis rufescens]|uniref:isochorismatase domain-containing protein 2-like isoform X1 n=1 Tax=Haliotis rufescens TaxID=6454 RepID=UPI00201F0974|nr:isochorismatase domain-containing protein 2-like isoform X1 [Haliotis rufescens]XP_048242034.1 isochorismatase domain-containing protein 2-like isoform X1 [Haliotis rufescens]XP_048242035.1 isochorismatase domain-containing protein 2-like isoform X2 [Haliotis rufescens]XP_048242037.1 isochorismatase domain-containing protein 2-like isoform X1 [Haliotis rufescens]